MVEKLMSTIIAYMLVLKLRGMKVNPDLIGVTMLFPIYSITWYLYKLVPVKCVSFVEVTWSTAMSLADGQRLLLL